MLTGDEPEPRRGKVIAILLPSLLGGGAERVALTLAKAFVERGHEVDLLVAQKRGELVDLVPPAVRLIDFNVPRLRNVLRPLIRYLRERRPDAIQISMWPLTIVGIIGARLSRVPVRCVVSNHSILSRHYRRSTHPLISATIRTVYPLADARVTVSNGTTDDVTKLSGLAQSSFDMISNPIEFPAELSRVPEMEALWGSCSNRILTLGHFKPEKNQAFLIRAFARLPREFDAKLMVAGNGKLLEELMAVATQEGVADRVIFPGFIADPWPVYASADLFALSSRHESFGNVLAEALYAGVPIVSTDNVGARAVLDGGRWGRLVAQDDLDGFARAMMEVLAQSPDRDALRQRAVTLCGEGPIEAYLDLLLHQA